MIQNQDLRVDTGDHEERDSEAAHCQYSIATSAIPRLNQIIVVGTLFL